MNDPVNKHIGQRLQMARCAKKMKREDLAERLDVSLTELEKHEKGKTSISAYRLFYAARSLSVKEQYFFDDYAENVPILEKIPVLDLELVHLIQQLSKKQRQHLLCLMKDLCG